MAEGKEPRCGFCGAAQSEVTQIVKGLDSFICDVCVHDCLGVIEDGRKVEPAKKKRSSGKVVQRHTPKQIKEHLDQYVIGQDRAKKMLAVAVYNHYKRIGVKNDTEIGKSNVLLVGPTGSGKTYLIETIAKMLDVPLAISDATTMTEAGYVGEDVESVLVRLVQNAEGNIKKAERGIVYIDEIDKIACSEGRGRDVSGEGVQQGLLKMLEGSIVAINPTGRKTATGPVEMVDTRNILFVCGGAFSGLLEDKNKKPRLGFTTEAEDAKAIQKKIVKHRDIVKYGMIPEFVGRLPIIAQLDPLSEDDLVHILTEPKNSLVKQYKELLSLDGVKINFSVEFLREAARQANAEGTGARGLRAIIEPALTEIMYRVPDEETETVEITEDLLKER